MTEDRQQKLFAEFPDLFALRLTAKEREAIKGAIRHYEDWDMDAGCWHAANTLRGLLRRHFPTPENQQQQDNSL